jgi:hypothetical protein
MIELFGQTDLPPGRVFQCQHCYTRLKEGQPHTALSPYPHQSLTTLVVSSDREDAFLDGYVYGSHAGVTGYRPALIPSAAPSGPGIGRIVTGPLVQGDDGLWREVAA